MSNSWNCFSAFRGSRSKFLPIADSLEIADPTPRRQLLAVEGRYAEVAGGKIAREPSTVPWEGALDRKARVNPTPLNTPSPPPSFKQRNKKNHSLSRLQNLRIEPKYQKISSPSLQKGKNNGLSRGLNPGPRTAVFSL